MRSLGHGLDHRYGGPDLEAKIGTLAAARDPRRLALAALVRCVEVETVTAPGPRM
jgi:hypothetical protein